MNKLLKYINLYFRKKGMLHTMLPIYAEFKNKLEIHHQKATHLAPHLHKSIECVLVTKGSLAIGIGPELYEMKEGDFAVVFPDLIHHYQVFDENGCRAIYLYIDPSLVTTYLETLQQQCPKTPVISKKNVDEDILYALKSLLRQRHSKTDLMLQQAFAQIILARSLPWFELIERMTIGKNDIVYQAVNYIAANFRNPISLTSMANDLGYSPYTLSRVFSGTFHKNFNQYLNEIRLEYACSLLLYTNQTITDIYMNAGFESQRTFNRVFLEEYRMSPRDYRKNRASTAKPIEEFDFYLDE